MTTPLEALLVHRERFRRFARRRVSSDAAAEDLVQEALVRALERSDSLRDPGRAVPWFYRLLRNGIADHHRSQASQSRGEEALRGELAGAGLAPSPEERPVRICGCARPLLATLRPTYASLLERIDLRGEAAEAVATELGITRNNLWVRLHRARRALRERLERACG